MAKAAKTPAKKEGADVAPRASGPWAGFDALRDEMDRMFDDFSRGVTRMPRWRRMAGAATAPAVDIVEKDKAFEVSVELPGMTESDIDVKVTDNRLTITGEKKDEREETDKGYHLSERRYGSFMRSFSLPPGVDAGKIDASFKSGVLRVTLPKGAEAAKPEKKIAIKKA
jgi:HSP20 family protein